jgi:hypothetical protein
VLHDVRIAIRSLANSPGYFMALALTFGLAMAASSAIFSAVSLNASRRYKEFGLRLALGAGSSEEPPAHFPCTARLASIPRRPSGATDQRRLTCRSSGCVSAAGQDNRIPARRDPSAQSVSKL